MEQRIPPQNVEAEQAVLGAMLLSHDAVIVAMEKLQSQDFYRDVHRIIFEAMEHLHRENKEIDVDNLVTFTPHIDDKPIVFTVGLQLST